MINNFRKYCAFYNHFWSYAPAGVWRGESRPSPPPVKSMRVFPPYRGLFLYVEGLVSTFGDLFSPFGGSYLLCHRHILILIKSMKWNVVNHSTLICIDKTLRFILFAIDNFWKNNILLLLLECLYSCLRTRENVSIGQFWHCKSLRYIQFWKSY